MYMYVECHHIFSVLPGQYGSTFTYCTYIVLHVLMILYTCILVPSLLFFPPTYSLHLPIISLGIP